MSVKKKPFETIAFDTFLEIGPYKVMQLTTANPSCINGEVRVEKFRVTVEKVQEPASVIRDRLQKLWDDCDNHHHIEPLTRAGLRYGIDLRTGQLLTEE